MKTADLVNALKYSAAPPRDGIDLWDEKGHREFSFNGQPCSYRAWDGETVPDHFVSLDTETVFIGTRLEQGEIPELVLATASGKDPSHNYVIHPKDIAAFLRKHQDRHLVFFHVAFDIAVIEKAVADRGEDEAIETLWCMGDRGQCHDLMLLDQLVRLAEGRGNYRQRSLAEVSSEVLCVELEKEDSPRQHYDVLLRQDYRGIAPEFYEYAVKDSRATLLAFEPVWKSAWELHNSYTKAGGTEADSARANMWAPLTEQIQVRGALALGAMSRMGVLMDAGKLREIIERTEEDLAKAVWDFEEHPVVIEFEKSHRARIFSHNPKGLIQSTEKGLPARSLKLLRGLFKELCAKHQERPPVTPKGLVSTSRDDYVGMQAFGGEDVFEKYFDIQAVAAELVKAEDLLAHVAADGCIYPQYLTLVKTGRATCRAPQIQNLPRAGELRGCFVPRPGHLFYAVDYSVVELTALASICRHRYGYSRLGDTLDAGEDPHACTASRILQKPPEDVTRQERQAAKAYNFGVPGGMGAEALAHHAKADYGVDMRVDEAKEWRRMLIREVYPEIGEFLDDYLGRFVSDKLGISEQQIIDALIVATEADRFSTDAREWILDAAERALRTGAKLDGEPYSDRWMKSIWLGLISAYQLSLSVRGRDPAIERFLKDQPTGKAVARAFFRSRAVTLTGRVWSDVDYRQAHNAQFQGLAADGAKLALYRLLREGLRPVLFIHDEVVVETDQGDRDAAAKRVDQILVEEMGRVIPDVRIRVEGRFMERWQK